MLHNSFGECYPDQNPYGLGSISGLLEIVFGLKNPLSKSGKGVLVVKKGAASPELGQEDEATPPIRTTNRRCV